MDEQELSRLSDDEFRARRKEMKTAEIAHAVLIGFMVGIIVYSVAKNTWGLVTLIPLFFIFKVLHRPERNRALKKVLAERGLDR
ncbi:FUSC family protein [Wenzhouxiangella sp. XN79A]|uniref:FUSC family protein n=1 Tax=Wenzhouxiangella sp. XN79A TaxID=2724193 RepID=UPI00144AA872|nr:FUSC family protein [Wenzhouxiangella sp. XN79A]NKI35817.1 FUSC family protein [Wenzhouxiangella sp. XN79A]